DALRLIAAEYTREAGVRSLERSIARVLRKVAAKEALEPDTIPVTVSGGNLKDYLGRPRFTPETSLTGDSRRTAVPVVATGRPVRSDVAMTGEVSLTGRVLPIGGVKQKLLAAHRAGITTVLIPQRNEPDLDDVPAEVLATLDVHPMSDVRDVLALALEPASS